MTNNKYINIAIQRIAEVRKNKLLFLDLRGLFLNKIPDDISDLSFLLDLDISNNYFTTIPKEIEELTNLQYLNVSNNNIFYLEVNFDKHICLKEIDISSNSINLVPDELNFLQEETKVVYFNNPFLKNLPAEIENQSFADVCYYLDLIKNQNDIYRFYESKLIFVGKGEVGKTTLAKVLKNNNFEFIQGVEPITHGINIDSITFNVLFPAHTPHYTNYRDIENVYLLKPNFIYEDNDDDDDDNDEYDPFENVYFTEDYENHELTSFTEILHVLDDDFLSSLIFSDDLKYHFENAVIEKEILMNVWDFGGQEIYYTTHQFFLTKRSIYIFVWEPRKDYNQDEFDYWLNTIKLISANSPVIVVMNKADLRHVNIDEQSLKVKFKNIVAFVNVSCKTKEGIDKLKNEIRKCIRQFPHMGNQIPKSWINIRKEIKSLGRDFINYTELIQLCNKIGNITSVKEFNLLSEYLHDIGEIIHFKDDSILKNIVIINPQWATHAVYGLLDTIPIQKNNGIFSLFDLENYWDLKIYPFEMHNTIIQLMEKFEICFKLVGERDIYVIPELLKTEISNPSIIGEIDSDENIKLQLEYYFMPSGIITKLICKLYSIIYKNNYWKNGAIFQHELSKGYVINDFSRKVLYIVVSGKQKGNLLAIIRNELKSIHNGFNMQEGIDFKEKIPCICDECKESKTPFYYEYDVLKKFLMKDKMQISCNKSADSIDINLLISGYASVKPTRKIIYQIISAASQLQGQNKNIVPTEDARNSFISDRLSQVGIIAKDQSQWGKSGTGINQGKLDIKIEDGKGNIITLFEGLNLKSIDDRSIRLHINKTINNYDPNGLLEKYLCIYYEGNNYLDFFKKYLVHVSSLSVFNSTVDQSYNLVENTEIKVLKSNYLRSERMIYLYHIIINMN